MINSDMVVYLVGPITPKSDVKNHALEYISNIREFMVYQAALMKIGVGVINPALDFFPLVYSEVSFDESIVKNNSIKLLKKSDAILLLPNWYYSVGSFEEFKIAMHLGLKIFVSIDEIKVLLKFGG